MAKRSKTAPRSAPKAGSVPAKPTKSAPVASNGGVRGGLSTVGYLLVWGVVLAVPLVLSPTAVDSFRLPKRMFGEWLGLASLLAFALAAALAPAWQRLVGEAAARAARPAWWRGAFAAVAPLTLVATLGLLVTDHPEHVHSALVDLWIGVACLVGWSLALDSDRFERLLAGLGLPGVLLSVLAILQYHDIYRPFAFSRGEEAARLGVTSLAGNTGDLAAFLVLPVLVAQWRLAGGGRRKRGGRGRQILWAVLLAVCLYALALTQTLTALAAVGAGSALFWLARLPRRKALAAAGGAAVLAVVLVLSVAPLRHRVTAGVDAFEGGRINQALSGRLDGWRAAWWMLEQHPLLGVGQGAYRAEFSPAKLALIERGVPFYRGHVDPFFANAHNEILEAGAEWGLAGWLALAWGLWCLGRAVVRGFGPRSGDGVRDGPALAELAELAGLADRSLAWGALAALAVLSIGQFPFRIALVAFPALLLMAWIFHRARQRALAEALTVWQDDETADAAETGSEAAGSSVVSSGGGLGRSLCWGAAVLLGLALVWQTGQVRDRIGASKRLRVVDAVTAKAVSSGGRVPPQLIGGSIRLLHQAERLDPSNVAIETALAGQYLLADRPQRAEEAFRQALALEPRPEIYLNLARTLLTKGDRKAAIQAYENAVRLAPRLIQQVPGTMRPAIRRATRPPADGS